MQDNLTDGHLKCEVKQWWECVHLLWTRKGVSHSVQDNLTDGHLKDGVKQEWDRAVNPLWTIKKVFLTELQQSLNDGCLKYVIG